MSFIAVASYDRRNTTEVIFSSLLRSELKRQGITQVVLAARIGVTQAAVSKWLNGTVPKGDQLLCLAKALGVTMEWLLTGDEPKKPVFAQWNRGFYVASCSYADGFTRECFAYDEAGAVVRLPEEKQEASIVIFRFHPPGHPEAMSRDEQIEFVERYAQASAEERRQMLSLGSGSERFFSERALAAFSVIMKRDLELSA